VRNFLRDHVEAGVSATHRPGNKLRWDAGFTLKLSVFRGSRKSANFDAVRGSGERDA
jgi:hypothetical protein